MVPLWVEEGEREGGEVWCQHGWKRERGRNVVPPWVEEGEGRGVVPPCVEEGKGKRGEPPWVGGGEGWCHCEEEEGEGWCHREEEEGEWRGLVPLWGGPIMSWCHLE